MKLQVAHLTSDTDKVVAGTSSCGPVLRRDFSFESNHPQCNYFLEEASMIGKFSRILNFFLVGAKDYDLLWKTCAWMWLLTSMVLAFSSNCQKWMRIDFSPFPKLYKDTFRPYIKEDFYLRPFFSTIEDYLLLSQDTIPSHTRTLWSRSERPILNWSCPSLYLYTYT